MIFVAGVFDAGDSATDIDDASNIGIGTGAGAGAGADSTSIMPNTTLDESVGSVLDDEIFDEHDDESILRVEVYCYDSIFLYPPSDNYHFQFFSIIFLLFL
jgi:hypothetical protein